MWQERNRLGKGDMLLFAKESTMPRRVQGALVEEDEISRIVDFWTNIAPRGVLGHRA